MTTEDDDESDDDDLANDPNVIYHQRFCFCFFFSHQSRATVVPFFDHYERKRRTGVDATRGRNGFDDPGRRGGWWWCRGNDDEGRGKSDAAAAETDTSSGRAERENGRER